MHGAGRPGRRRRSTRSAGRCRASTTPHTRQPLHVRVQPDRLPRRPVRPGFAGNAFVSEPVHNLVHREVVTPHGVHLHEPAGADDEQSREFLASTRQLVPADDARPGRTGRCGSPTCTATSSSTRSGSRRLAEAARPAGRARHGPHLPRPPGRDVTAADPAARQARHGAAGRRARQPERLAARHRSTMLLWRTRPGGGATAGDAGRDGRPAAARLHALCTLDGLHALRPEVLRQALADSHAGVRRHAVRLAEPMLTQAGQLGPQLLKLADDPDAQVRMQLAYTLGESDDPRAGAALGGPGRRGRRRSYLTAAVLSSSTRSNFHGVEAGHCEGVIPPAELLRNCWVRRPRSVTTARRRPARRRCEAGRRPLCGVAVRGAGRAPRRIGTTAIVAGSTGRSRRRDQGRGGARSGICSPPHGRRRRTGSSRPDVLRGSRRVCSARGPDGLNAGISTRLTVLLASNPRPSCRPPRSPCSDVSVRRVCRTGSCKAGPFPGPARVQVLELLPAGVMIGSPPRRRRPTCAGHRRPADRRCAASSGSRPGTQSLRACAARSVRRHE